MAKDYKWEVDATSDEQAEYEQVMGAISKTIYENDQSFEAIKNMLGEGDPVDSLVRTTVMIITEVDKQLAISKDIIHQLPMWVFDMLNEIGTKAGFFTLDDEQTKTGMAAAQDTVNRVYGISEEEFMGASKGMDEQDVSQLASAYEVMTNGQGFSTQSTK